MTTLNERALIAADHLVGNLWYNMDILPLIVGKLEPETMRAVIGGPAAMAYSEMCRLMTSDTERLSAGALDAGLRLLKFDFDWIRKLQARIMVESPENLDSYVQTINNAADLRNLQMYCSDALDNSKDEDARAEVLTAELMTKLTKVNKSANTVVHVSESTAHIRERLASIREGKITWGALTGFKDLDKLMRLVDSELIIIAGRPSQGKTALGFQMIVNRAHNLKTDNEDGQVVIFSAEMNRDELFLRGACTLGKVNLDRVVTNKATMQESKALDDALDYLDTLPIRVDDTPALTVEQIYYRTAMLNASKSVRLVLADHTELFSAKAESETLRVNSITRGFKGVAKTLNTPFIDLHQLGRSVDERADKQPVLSDLKYAGEADGDKILFIHRPEYYLKRGDTCSCDISDAEGVAILTLAKNRNGPVGRVRAAFIEKYAMFGDLETTRVQL